jgi:hypothetical protein
VRMLVLMAQIGMLVLTLVVAILGALAGIPSLRTWRVRWTHTGAA